MRFNSGFERPTLRRRMVTKGQKYSQYRAASIVAVAQDENMPIVEKNKDENDRI